MTDHERTVADLRGMARGMASYAPMSSGMISRLADDVGRKGPIAALVGDHPDASAPLFHLRVLAGVRWLVLSGRVPALDTHLRHLTSRMEDPGYIEATWDLFRRVVLEHPQEIRAALDRPVQQHQPRRAGVLLAGLAMLAAPRVRLLEIGACAGLNLLLDRYHWFGDGWEWGAPDSLVRLTAAGRSPGPVEIVDRAGCDLAPRDPGNPVDAVILRSFIPQERDIDQLELDDALSVAARSDLRVVKADAVRWLHAELEQHVRGNDVYTVLWHSLFLGYLTRQQQDAIEEILRQAARRMPLARISYEPHSWRSEPRLQLTLYS
ncbi:DUF2332 domain-containing protein [Streptomyces sp. NPDC001858]